MSCPLAIPSKARTAERPLFLRAGEGVGGPPVPHEPAEVQWSQRGKWQFWRVLAPAPSSSWTENEVFYFLSPLWVCHCLFSMVGLDYLEGVFQAKVFSDSQARALALSSCFGAMTLHPSCGTTAVHLTAPCRLGREAGVTYLDTKNLTDN